MRIFVVILNSWYELYTVLLKYSLIEENIYQFTDFPFYSK